MASSSYKTIFLLELILFLLNVSLFPTTNGTPLDDVCGRVSDRGFCVRDFGSDPQTKNADVFGLAGLALDRAQKDGNKTVATIRKLIQRAADGGLIDRLTRCLDSYLSNVYALKVAKMNLGALPYDDVSNRARKGFEAAVQCEKSFVRSPLTSENRDFKNLCDIIRVTANYLNSGRGRA